MKHLSTCFSLFFLVFTLFAAPKAFAQDAGVVTFVSPTSGCGIGSATPVTVQVTNFGAAPIASFDAQFSVDGTPSPVETFATAIAAGATETVTFAATADLSGGGSFLVEATTLLAGDTDPSNDLLATTVSAGVLSGLPVEQDFNALALGATIFPPPLSNDPLGFLDFEVNSGTTTSIATGPSAGAGGSGRYIYMEASFGAPFQGAILQTECLDLTFAVSPRLIYAYHMFGSGISSMTVTAVRGGLIDTLSEFIGQQQTASTDPWLYDTVDLTPYVGQTLQLKWTGLMGVVSFTNSDIALDDIKIEDPQDNDLGSVELLSPAAACGLSTTETITHVIRNYGLLDQTGYDMGFRVNGPTGVFTSTENVGLEVTASGEFDTLSFVTTADFSLPGTYTIRTWSNLAGDANPGNDTLTTSFSIPAAILPIFDDFDSYAEGITVFPDWFNLTTDDLQWETEAGTTTSTATGPSGDASPGGLGNYIYMETSSPATWLDVAEMRSQCISLSAGTSPEFVFAYHMFGDAIGALTIDLESGGVSTNVINIVGQQQTATTDAWRRDTVDLTPFLGTSFEIVIRGSIGPLTTGVSFFDSDISIDELGILNPLPNDIGATTLLNPTEDGGCDLGSALSVSMEISNFGLSDQTGFNVGYSITGPTGPAFSVENVGALVVPGGGTAIYNFATPVDLSADGLYTVKVFTALPSDAIAINDTLTTVLENVTEISIFPWVEDFEAFTVCGVACASDCEDDVANNWVQDQTDGNDWLTDAGGTGSTGTGPSIDALPGTSVGQYLYLESSGCNNIESRLISPCIDIGATTIPGVRFSYHMFGDDMGSLAVDVSEDDGGSWTELWSRSGQDQLSSVAPWKEVSVPLVGYGPIIKLRFRGLTGPSGFESDMAIDAITVLDIPPFDDAGAFAVLDPKTQCELTTAENITIVVRNTGTNLLPGYNINYEVNGPTGFASATEVIATPLAAGDADTLTFATPVDMSLDGDYTVAAFTFFPTDTVTSNDTVVAVISNIITVPFPAFDDFDAYPEAATTFDFLDNDPLADLLWETEEGTTTSTLTGPLTDISGLGNYIYIETSSGVLGSVARICTPCLDLSAGGDFPSMRYGYHMFGAAMGRLDVDVLSAGDTIAVDSLIGQQQIAEAAPWLFHTVPLAAFDSTQIQVCFTGTRGTTFTSDMALDNIDIRDPFLDDLRTTAIPDPLDDCGLGTAELISLSIGNVGVNTQSGFDVSYQVDGGPIVTEVFAGTIVPDQDTVYVFTATVDFSAEGVYNVKAWSDLDIDEGRENDTTFRTVTHIITVDAFPYVEDFEGAATGWTDAGINSSWEIGVPAGTSITTAFSGTNAYMTGLSTPYNDDERSIVIAPCMDFTSLDNPGMKVSLNYVTQAGLITAQDGFVIQSSLDNGLTWKNIGEFGDPDNWYNFNNIDANPGDQVPSLPTAAGWAGFSAGWKEARHALDGLGGENNVAFRIAFASDGTGTGLDGVAIDDFIITELPAVFLGPDTAICAGYVLDAGNPGLTYDWSSGDVTQTITVTTSGLYTVTVTDGFGFTASDVVNITILPSPTVDLGPTTITSCGPVSLDAGNPGAAYFWNTGENSQTITATLDGTYSVLVTSGPGCQGRDSITVDIQALPDASFAYSLSGGFVEFFDASTAGMTWSWDFGDGGTSADQNPNYAYSASGNYLVTLVVTNDCGSDTITQSLAIFSTGLYDENLAASIRAFPVPTTGILNLVIDALQPGQQAVVGVFNATGQLVRLESVGRTGTINLQDLASGTYVLQFDVAGRNASRTISVE